MLAHGIAESQTFIDANKRLALVAMLAFLELNGYRVLASDAELAGWIVSLSSGTTPEQLAQLVRGKHAVHPRNRRGCRSRCGGKAAGLSAV